MTDWFTADWHLDHDNIIKHCNRPFKDVKEMNTTIIDNANDLVKVNDRLIHLGDVEYRGSGESLSKLIARINCKNMAVVLGNHDREHVLSKYFTILPQCYEYRNEDYRIILCHYAMRVWSKSHHGSVHLYGHSHGTLPLIPGMAAFDIGVDSWNFKPLSLDQVKAEMIRLCPIGKTLVGDHHTGK